jgi:hypothetical protein
MEIPFGSQFVRNPSDSDADWIPRRTFLSAVIGVPIPEDLNGRNELDWWILERATEQRLDPSFVFRLRNVGQGGVSHLLSRSYSAEPADFSDRVKAAGYELLRFAPPGSKAITTNQDRLIEKFTYLRCVAVNGQVHPLYLDDCGRIEASSDFSMFDRSILEPGFVLAGTPQPSSLAGSESLERAWRISPDTTSVILIGYSFAQGLDVGCWQQFCSQVGSTRIPVFVVDPDAHRVCVQLAYGMINHPPVPVPVAWQCLAYLVLTLMNRLRLQCPCQTNPYVFDILRAHDRLREFPWSIWNANVRKDSRREIPKSLSNPL